MSDRMSGSWDKYVKIDEKTKRVNVPLRSGIPASDWPIVRVIQEKDFAEVRDNLSDSMMSKLKSMR